jgi:hypothetical protein
MRRTKVTLQQLENFLFSAADILRGKMGAAEYKRSWLSNATTPPSKVSCPRTTRAGLTAATS